MVNFGNVENLRGAAGNKDTFTVLGGGSLAGLMDGGVGGCDSLVLDSGVHASVIYLATGPDSGTIARDTDVLDYAGLEPIIDNLVVADRIVATSNLTDNARLADLGAQLILESTDVIPAFESVTFAKPTNSLTINLGGDLGIPLIPDTLDIQAVTLAADLIVNGQGGDDVVTITGNAERITVDPGVTINADNILLNAVATVGGVVTPDTFPLANVAAAVNVDGASLSGASVTLSATATLVSSIGSPLPTCRSRRCWPTSRRRSRSRATRPSAPPARSPRPQLPMSMPRCSLPRLPGPAWPR